MAVASFVFGYAHSLALLDGARFVQGVAGACTWAGGLAWLGAAVAPETSPPRPYYLRAPDAKPPGNILQAPPQLNPA